MRFRTTFLVLVLVAASSSSLCAQQFSVAAYSAYLQSHANVTSGQLLQEYPAGKFLDKVTIDPSTVAYLDSVVDKLGLTADEQQLLLANGFVVTERVSTTNFALGFEDPWHKDLPVFVTTDAILHAVHMSYDNILKASEKNIFEPLLKQALTDMLGYMGNLEARYGGNSSMEQALRDADVFITVANKLLGNAATPYYASNTTYVDEVVGYCDGYIPKELKLFSDTRRFIDFSQFKPRGHYEPTPNSPLDLRQYFKAMIWLGRTELVLGSMNPNDPNYQQEDDIRRQALIACLLQEAIDGSGAAERLNKIDKALSFIVGESDNVTLDNLTELRSIAGVTSADLLWDPAVFQHFQDALATAPYAGQRINSQLLLSNPFNTLQIEPASAFLIMGQRFVIDSYVLGNVVFDNIMYNNTKIRRMLPDPLDAMFALGNNAAGQLLIDELDSSHYGQNLAGLRYLVDSYETDFWDLSLYNYWLNGIRTLNPPQDRSQFPQAMQTGAWWQQKLNTQLASWAQLRHDNILYAKQSYSAIYSCSYPEAYLEPYPELYASLARYAREAKTVFQPLVADGAPAEIVPYYEHFAASMDSLVTIASRELNGQPLTADQIAFLKSVMYVGSGCAGPEYSGWFPSLFFTIRNDESFKEVDTDDATVADVHTAGSDKDGNIVGWVYHVGTGKVNTCVMIAPSQNGGLTAYTGPVLSYYEHITDQFERLTDEEWEPKVLPQTLPRPDWTNIYLADKNGASKQGGRRLEVSSSPNVAVSLAFVRDTLRLRAGNTVSIELDLRNAFGKRISRTATWSATGGTITNGVFTAAQEPGFYSVTVALEPEGLGATLPVRIFPPLDSLAISPANIREEFGYPFNLSIAGFGPTGEDVELYLDWKLVNVASYGNGIYSAQYPQIPASITAIDTLSGLFVTATVDALDRPASITLEPAAPMHRGAAGVQFTATVYNISQQSIDADLIWSCTGGTITSDGYYTSGSIPGTYSIQCRNKHNTALGAVTATVLPGLTRIDLGPDSVYLDPMETYTFAPAGFGSAGNPVELFPVWDSQYAPQDGSSYTMPECGEPKMFRMSDRYAPGVTDDLWIIPTTSFKSLVMVAPPLIRANRTADIGVYGLDCEDAPHSANVAMSSTFGMIAEGNRFDPKGETGVCRITAQELGSPLSVSTDIEVLPELASLTIVPNTPTITTGKQIQLSATGRDKSNTELALYGVWTADGGAVTQSGMFSAPDIVGTYRVSFTDTLAGMTETAEITVDESTGLEGIAAPASITLAQNYPNPFNPVTTIEYGVPARMQVTLRVYNNLGALVATLASGITEPGTHRAEFNASALGRLHSGTYLYTLQTDAGTLSRWMTVVK